MMHLYFRIFKSQNISFSHPMQVTNSKAELEKAYKLSKKLQDETTKVEEFISTTDSDLTQREVQEEPVSPDQELEWIKVGRCAVCQVFNKEVWKKNLS